MSKIKNHLIFLGGFISLILGIIGIALPILPTTPFLLLASAAFAKSSERFHRWLLNNKILGAYIKNYQEGKGLPLKIKLITISLLWITIIISILFLMKLFWVQIVLVIIAIAVSVHISLIKPKKLDGT
ncbi:MAG: YbaN family protein [Candidatus Hodarchaeota archaeon]